MDRKDAGDVLRQVIFRMPAPRTRAHRMDATGPDAMNAARILLTRDRAASHMGGDFHVVMRVAGIQDNR